MQGQADYSAEMSLSRPYNNTHTEITPCSQLVGVRVPHATPLPMERRTEAVSLASYPGPHVEVGLVTLCKIPACAEV